MGILIILLVKKLVKNHISARWQYNLGLLFFILLTIPLVPSHFIAPLNMASPMEIMRFDLGVAGNVGGYSAYSRGWMQDFAISVEGSSQGYLPMILFALWVAGVIACTVIIFLGNKNLRLIIESVKPVEDEALISLFARCKTEAGIRSHILLGTSILIKTPMTVGFFKTRIILPTKTLSASDAHYAILHELSHCKSKDIQINVIMCLFQMIYWFNPLVYFVFKQMRLERELACDASVLAMLPKALHSGYGKALLNYLFSHTSRPIFSADMGGSKPQIFRRIQHIASYTTDSFLLKTKSICLFVLMGLFVLCKIPMASAFASGSDNNHFHFQTDNVQYVDLSGFFGDFNGSFVLYNVNDGFFTVYNRSMSTTRVSPTSTYKIISALIALETGVLDINDTHRVWDGTAQPFESWERDHDLISAMQYSVNWYFQDNDVQVGIQRLGAYLADLSYGNHNAAGGIESFWNHSSLRISPVEQVKLLRNLHHNNTAFEAEHFSHLKDALRLSENNGAMLYGKTGTGIIGDKFTDGWFIGFVENNGQTSIFATYIQGEDSAGGSVAARIALSILEYKGIY